MDTQKILIPKPQGHLAKVGEVYDLTFNTITIPFLSDVQIRAIKNSVNKNDKFKVVDANSHSGKLVLRVEIVKNPFPIAIAISAVTTSLIGLFVYLSISKVEQVINTPEGKTNNLAASLGIGAALLALIGLKKGF